MVTTLADFADFLDHDDNDQLTNHEVAEEYMNLRKANDG
jgi:hypothetical protein